MTPTAIFGFVLLGLIILSLITLVDSSLKEGTKKYNERIFTLTPLELILYGLYLLFSVAIGVLVIYIVIKIFDNLILSGIALLVGLLFAINFILFLNHLIYELFQKVYIDTENKKVTLMRMGKFKEIELNKMETVIHYFKPINDKEYGRSDFQIFGAKFDKIILSDENTHIKISALNRIKLKDLLLVINEEKVQIIKRQINFIY